MARELYRLQPGVHRLIVERVARDGNPAWASDMIRYEVRVPGPPSTPPLAGGVVHEPDSDDRLGARRVIPALGGTPLVQSTLDLETTV